MNLPCLNRIETHYFSRRFLNGTISLFINVYSTPCCLATLTIKWKRYLHNFSCQKYKFNALEVSDVV